MMDVSANDQLNLNKVDELINSGKWDAALKLAQENAKNPALAVLARTWVQLGLVARLKGLDKLVLHADEQAEGCDDFTDEMRGDRYRNEAILELKRGNTDCARNLCADAMVIHGSNRNKQAAACMVFGRIALQTGNVFRALDYHRCADRMWRGIDDEADSQWVTNNLTHWLQAAVLSWNYIEAISVLRRLLRNEKNPSRKWAAWAVFVGHRPAYKFILWRAKRSVS